MRPYPTDDAIADAQDALASGLDLDPPRTEAARWAIAGDYQRLVDRHLWLAVAKAHAHTPARGTFETCPALAYQALSKAAADWRPADGFRFGTHASWAISQALRPR